MNESEKDLGKDRIFGKPVSEFIEEWNKFVIYSDLALTRQNVFNFWVGGPEEKVNMVIDSIKGSFRIRPDQVIELKAEPDQRDIVPQLLRFSKRIKAMPGRKVMILVRNYERALADEKSKYILARHGHDWNQDVVERVELWEEIYSGKKGKHLIIITTIEFSCGEEIYKIAVRSAAGSQFSDGIIEV